MLVDSHSGSEPFVEEFEVLQLAAARVEVQHGQKLAAFVVNNNVCDCKFGTAKVISLHESFIESLDALKHVLLPSFEGFFRWFSRERSRFVQHPKQLLAWNCHFGDVPAEHAFDFGLELRGHQFLLNVGFALAEIDVNDVVSAQDLEHPFLNHWDMSSRVDGKISRSFVFLQDRVDFV